MSIFDRLRLVSEENQSNEYDRLNPALHSLGFSQDITPDMLNSTSILNRLQSFR